MDMQQIDLPDASVDGVVSPLRLHARARPGARAARDRAACSGPAAGWRSRLGAGERATRGRPRTGRCCARTRAASSRPTRTSPGQFRARGPEQLERARVAGGRLRDRGRRRGGAGGLGAARRAGGSDRATSSRACSASLLERCSSRWTTSRAARRAPSACGARDRDGSATGDGYGLARRRRWCTCALTLEDRLAERARDELDGERAVAFSRSRIGFTSTTSSEPTRPDSATSSQREVRLAVGEAAADRRADAGRDLGVERVQVERDVDEARAGDARRATRGSRARSRSGRCRSS